MKVKIKNSIDIGNDWRGRTGKLVAVVKERKYKYYIVQFTNPTEWSYFRKKEIYEQETNKKEN